MTSSTGIVDDLGKAQGYHGDSAFTLAATAQLAAVLLLIQFLIVVFLLVRRRRTKGLAAAFLLVAQAETNITTAAPTSIHLDFMRYLLALCRLFCVASLAFLPILLPVNVLQPRRSGRAQGLDRFSYTNIPSARAELLWVHLFMLGLFTLLCCVMIHAELITQTDRDAATPRDRSSRFIIGCVNGDMTEKELRDAISAYCPGEVLTKRVLFDSLVNVDTEALSSVLGDIERTVIKLKNSSIDTNIDRTSLLGSNFSFNMFAPFPLTSRLQRLRRILETAESSPADPQLLLIEVDNARDRDFVRTLSHKRLAFVETLHDLSDVIWANAVVAFSPALRLSFPRRQALKFLPAFAAVALALPVSFQGLFAYFQEFMAVIWHSPDLRFWPSTWLASYFSGVFPQLLALLFVYFSPVVIRRLVTSRRFISACDRDLACAKYLFVYLFFQVFVFVSFSTTLTAALSFVVRKPDEIPELFSVNLPKAANYFISYIIVQGLTLAVTSLLDWKYIIGKYVLSRMSVRTMREQMMLDCPSDLDWVVLFPTATLLAIIGMTYAVMTPLILPCIAFVFVALFWSFGQRIALVADAGDSSLPTLYTSSLLQLFYGLYAQQLCLLGTFASLRDPDGRRTSLVKAVSVSLILVSTIYCHIHCCRLKCVGSASCRYFSQWKGWASLQRMATIMFWSSARGTWPATVISPPLVPYRKCDIASVQTMVNISEGDESCQVKSCATIHVPMCDPGVALHLKACYVEILSYIPESFARRILLVQRGYVVDSNGCLHTADKHQALECLRLHFKSGENYI